MTINQSLTSLTNELVAIYTYDDLESYYVGKVENVDKENVTLQLLNKGYKWIGIKKIEISDIWYLSFRTSYEKKLNQSLYNS